VKRFALLALLTACGAEEASRTITIDGPGRIWSPDAAFECDGATCVARGPVPLRVYAAPEPAFVAWSNGCEDIACDVDADVTVSFTAPSCAGNDATVGVVLYGQSLALGTQGAPALTSTAAFPGEVFVLNPAADLLCDAREGRGCGWPDVESPRTAIVETWRRLRGEGRFVMTSHGQGSTAIAELSRGSAAYGALLDRIERTKTLLDGDYVVPAVAFVHGPADEGNDDYATRLAVLAEDLDRDIRAITGQTSRVHLFIDQTSSWTRPPTPHAPNVTLAQLAACLEHRHIHCVAPQYDLDFTEDRLHLVAASYRALGERFGAAMHQRFDRCEPSDAPYVETAIGADVIDVRYNTPVVVDLARCPKQPGFGFELVKDGELRSIRRVTATSDDRLRIETADACGAQLRYAFTGEPSGGGGCREDGARAPAGNVHGERAALTQSIRVVCAD
jgi:hypothetical protein